MAELDEQDTSRATNDAYTGMLAISLLALMIGSLLLFLDWNQYPEREPKALPKAPPSLVAPEKAGGEQAPPQGQPVPPQPPMADKK